MCMWEKKTKTLDICMGIWRYIPWLHIFFIWCAHVFISCLIFFTRVLIKARMPWVCFCSVSSPDLFFMLNPPRKSPEAFEVLGYVNKDVTIPHTLPLNEYRRFDVAVLQHPKERDALQVCSSHLPVHSSPPTQTPPAPDSCLQYSLTSISLES